MNRKSINFFISSLRRGGSERVCITLAKSLSNLNVEVNIIVLGFKNTNDLTLPNLERVNVTYLNCTRALFSGVKLYQLIKKEKYNNIFCFNYEICAVILLISKMKKRYSPNIVLRVINTMSKKFKPGQRFREGIFKYTLRNSTTIVSQSLGIDRDLSTFFDCHDSIIINNPVSVEIALSDSAPDLLKDKNYFLAVGSLTMQKNPILLINSYKKYRDKGGCYSLVIVGKGEESDWIKKIVSGMNLNEWVIFVNELNSADLSIYYSGASSLILTSRYEGFPNVVLEALKCGCPTISYKGISGIRDIITSVEYGVTLNGYTEDSFAQGMINIQSKEEGYSFSKSALIKRSRDFSPEIVAKKYLQLF
jgi:glycosyltransferase involved in cell wall biosynthesis